MNSSRSLPSDLVFREALPSDSQQIMNFQISMALETENISLNPQRCKSGVEEIFIQRGQLGRYFVIEQRGNTAGGSNEIAQVVGCLLLTQEWSDWRCGFFYWIQSLYVVPQMRKKGLFMLFFDYIRNEAVGLMNPSKKCYGLRLYVEKSNETAKAAYRRVAMRQDHYELFEMEFV